MGRQNYDSIYFSRYKLINRAAKMLMVAFLGPQHLVSHLKDLFDKKVFESALSEFAKHFARWPLDLVREKMRVLTFILSTSFRNYYFNGC